MQQVSQQGQSSQPPPPPPQPPSAETELHRAAPPADHPSAHVPRTRTAKAWTLLAVGGVSLTLVLIFILQNLTPTPARFVTTRWTIPLGIDLLLAALLGGFVVFLLGAARMFQLRRLVRRGARSQSKKE